MTLTSIPHDEKVSKSININAAENVVDVLSTCKPATGSAEKYVLNWRFDFGNASQKDILRLATNSLIITMQRKLREDAKAGRSLDDYGDATFDVAAVMVEQKRQAKSNVEKAETLINKMSAAEREALKAMLAEQNAA